MFPGFNNSKRRGTISQGDFDRDGVKNLKDCNAMDFRKQDGGEPLRLDYTEDELTEIKKRTRKINRESNKMARDLGYPRGIKQMKEEGDL